MIWSGTNSKLGSLLWECLKKKKWKDLQRKTLNLDPVGTRKNEEAVRRTRLHGANHTSVQTQGAHVRIPPMKQQSQFWLRLLQNCGGFRFNGLMKWEAHGMPITLVLEPTIYTPSSLLDHRKLGNKLCLKNTKVTRRWCLTQPKIRHAQTT